MCPNESVRYNDRPRVQRAARVWNWLTLVPFCHFTQAFSNRKPRDSTVFEVRLQITATAWRAAVSARYQPKSDDVITADLNILLGNFAASREGKNPRRCIWLHTCPHPCSTGHALQTGLSAGMHWGEKMGSVNNVGTYKGRPPQGLNVLRSEGGGYGWRKQIRRRGRQRRLMFQLMRRGGWNPGWGITDIRRKNEINLIWKEKNVVKHREWSEIRKTAVFLIHPFIKGSWFKSAQLFNQVV